MLLFGGKGSSVKNLTADHCMHLCMALATDLTAVRHLVTLGALFQRNGRVLGALTAESAHLCVVFLLCLGQSS